MLNEFNPPQVEAQKGASRALTFTIPGLSARGEKVSAPLPWRSVADKNTKNILFHSKSNVFAVEVEYFEFEVEYFKIEVEYMKFDVEFLSNI